MEKSHFLGDWWFFMWFFVILLVGTGEPPPYCNKNTLGKIGSKFGIDRPPPPQLGHKPKFFQWAYLKAPLSWSCIWESLAKCWTMALFCYWLKYHYWQKYHNWPGHVECVSGGSVPRNWKKVADGFFYYLMRFMCLIHINFYRHMAISSKYTEISAYHHSCCQHAHKRGS